MKEGVAVGEKGWSQGEVARWSWGWVCVGGVQVDGVLNETNRGREIQRGEKGDGRGVQRGQGAGEAMRRKSTAHQGEIEMMEGSQLRRRDRRMETR